MSEPQQTPSTWDDVRRLVDEIQLDVHLARMEVRDRWEAVRPRIDEMERRVKHAGETFANDMTSLGLALQKIVADMRASH